MWALGCIYGEMFELAPLFRGENDSDQIKCISRRLCTAGRVHASFEDMCASKCTAALRASVVACDCDELTLFQSMLRLNHTERASADTLAHLFGKLANKSREMGTRSVPPSVQCIEIACYLSSQARCDA